MMNTGMSKVSIKINFINVKQEQKDLVNQHGQITLFLKETSIGYWLIDAKFIKGKVDTLQWLAEDMKN